jgi:hypothetical protein
VNWVKGASRGSKSLQLLAGNKPEGPWEKKVVQQINSSLSFSTDVAEAKRLQTNGDAKACFQGQTHGHEGFLLTPQQARELIKCDQQNRQVIFPYLSGDDLLSTCPPVPARFAIDFHPCDLLAAAKFKQPFAIIKKLVLPDREAAARRERERNDSILKANPTAPVNRHHENFLRQWWLFGWARAELIQRIAQLRRYVVCSRVTKRPIFEFVCRSVRPNDSLMVFAFADDYSFGILQSGVHWAWFTAKCSTLTERFRYTSDTVFDTFPWPQWRDVFDDGKRETGKALAKITAIAEAAREVRRVRRQAMQTNGWSLRVLYRTVELPGVNKLREAHAALDAAVRAAYGMPDDADILAFLLDLNLSCAARETKGEPVTPPGLPEFVSDISPLLSRDCVSAAIL